MEYCKTCGKYCYSLNCSNCLKECSACQKNCNRHEDNGTEKFVSKPIQKIMFMLNIVKSDIQYGETDTNLSNEYLAHPSISQLPYNDENLYELLEKVD